MLMYTGGGKMEASCVPEMGATQNDDVCLCD